MRETWAAHTTPFAAVTLGFFTIVLNVPINNAVLTSDRAALPADRETTRTPWNTLNAIRIPINYLSFLLMI
ncbi:anthrone oxygenase family protein [uncultured Chloroflexus sp.]|uniref:anthrone oxygenase family protein n=1 Tax=uncultured Chloroflexus sp. TaxID=214040 RepID=UPI002621E758|nr:anthrone oxygenase family protein [uncultured Chloroflexus sp.]